ncbi:MAG: PLDc N-terminal domain-containing protein [Defluviitaleaceae bacterium]|nr:PLDc N-terminal domain-containing protein [Defluviitaleaceae bacterium]
MLYYSFAEIWEAYRTLLLAMIPLAIIQLALFVSALVSCLRKPVAGNEKILWLLLIILVSIIGPIIYFAIGSKQLDEKAQR